MPFVKSSVFRLLIIAQFFCYNANTSAQVEEITVFDAFGKQSFHLQCVGTGTPTVILEGGIKYWSEHYVHLLPALGKLTRICLYDRPGYGRSSVGVFPRSSEQAAFDIASVIEAADIETPVIIAGHSLGGINALSFAALFRELVAGVVLIDSAHPQQYERFAPEIALARDFQIQQYQAYAERQVKGLAIDVSADTAPWLSEETNARIRKQLEENETYAAMASELTSLPSAHAFLSENLKRKLDVPLVVLTAENSFELFRDALGEDLQRRSQDLWNILQKEFMQYSNDSVQLLSKGDHALEQSDPEMIKVAIDLVLSKIEN